MRTRRAGATASDRRRAAAVAGGKPACRFTSEWLLCLPLRPLERGEHFAGVGLDERLLIAADVVEGDLVEAKVNEGLKIGGVLSPLGCDEKAALRVSGAHEPGHCPELLGAADVALGKVHTAIGPLANRLLRRRLATLSPGDVELEDARQRRRIFARLARALLEAAQEV